LFRSLSAAMATSAPADGAGDDEHDTVGTGKTAKACVPEDGHGNGDDEHAATSQARTFLDVEDDNDSGRTATASSEQSRGSPLGGVFGRTESSGSAFGRIPSQKTSSDIGFGRAVRKGSEQSGASLMTSLEDTWNLHPDLFNQARPAELAEDRPKHVTTRTADRPDDESAFCSGTVNIDVAPPDEEEEGDHAPHLGRHPQRHNKMKKGPHEAHADDGQPFGRPTQLHHRTSNGPNQQYTDDAPPFGRPTQLHHRTSNGLHEPYIDDAPPLGRPTQRHSRDPMTVPISSAPSPSAASSGPRQSHRARAPFDVDQSMPEYYKQQAEMAAAAAYAAGYAAAAEQAARAAAAAEAAADRASAAAAEAAHSRPPPASQRMPPPPYAPHGGHHHHLQGSLTMGFESAGSSHSSHLGGSYGKGKGSPSAYGAPPPQHPGYGDYPPGGLHGRHGTHDQGLAQGKDSPNMSRYPGAGPQRRRYQEYQNYHEDPYADPLYHGSMAPTSRGHPSMCPPGMFPRSGTHPKYAPVDYPMVPSGVLDGGLLDDGFDDASGARLNEPVEKTTIMLRNLPEGFFRDMVTGMLATEGFAKLVDFVYVPMNFRNKASFGYAFVNLVSAEAAKACRVQFEGYTRWPIQSEKVCEVSWSDMHQGLDAHIERYRNSPLMHNDVHDEFKPAIFRNGVRMPFPPPTRPIRPPRVRRQGADLEDDVRPNAKGPMQNGRGPGQAGNARQKQKPSR